MSDFFLVAPPSSPSDAILSFAYFINLKGDKALKVLKFNLRDIFQWVEREQIYAVHQTHSAQGVDPHNLQFCDDAQHSRGLKEKW